jgi:hypothetical protein
MSIFHLSFVIDFREVDVLRGGLDLYCIPKDSSHENK